MQWRKAGRSVIENASRLHRVAKKLAGWRQPGVKWRNEESQPGCVSSLYENYQLAFSNHSAGVSYNVLNG
jgi:hypothetical protein